MTFLDMAVNNFFANAGGVDFLGVLFSIPVIFGIMSSIIRPFDV